MDILILNNYINKVASDEDARKAMKYTKAFIEERKENLNYFLRTI